MALSEVYSGTATRYVSAPLGLGSTASIITSLRDQLYGGAPIVAANIRAIVDLYNTWIYHYHEASDLVGVDTFGNEVLYGTGAWNTRYTSTPISGSAASFTAAGHPTYMYTDNPIYASEVMYVINNVNSARYHYHTVDDAGGAAFP